MFDTNVFKNIKTPQDFAREEQEFEFRKRQREMQEKLGGLEMQKLEREMSAPKMPFEGTGLEAQLINQKYLANVQAGMDEQTALQNATDTVLQSQVTTDARGNVLRRGAIFGTPSQINSMPPSQAMGMPTSGYTPSYNPNSPALTMAGSGQPYSGETMSPMPMTVADIETAIGGQPIQRPSAPLTVNPQDFGITSPYGMEDVQKKAAEANIQMQIEQAKADRKTGKAQKTIATTLDELDLLNNQLRVKQAIVSGDQNALQNLKAALGSSQFGQAVSQTQDVDVQTLRNQYNLARNSLIPFYVDYFQLPATMVDTEKMSQRIIEAFGDPSLDYTTNQTAINRMRGQFGITQGGSEAPTNLKEKYGLE